LHTQDLVRLVPEPDGTSVSSVHQLHGTVHDQVKQPGEVEFPRDLGGDGAYGFQLFDTGLEFQFRQAAFGRIGERNQHPVPGIFMAASYGSFQVDMQFLDGWRMDDKVDFASRLSSHKRADNLPDRVVARLPDEAAAQGAEKLRFLGNLKELQRRSIDVSDVHQVGTTRDGFWMFPKIPWDIVHAARTQRFDKGHDARVIFFPQRNGHLFE
jgi:hypothetical protein